LYKHRLKIRITALVACSGGYKGEGVIICFCQSDSIGNNIASKLVVLGLLYCITDDAEMWNWGLFLRRK